MAICTFNASEACIEDLMMQARKIKRCGSTPPLTIFVAYAPTSSYEDEELESFHVDLERLYREEHTFFKSWWGESYEVQERKTQDLHQLRPRRFPSSKWEDSVIDNIDEEYNRLVVHLHDSATKAESLQVVKRRLSSKTLELIR
uniref:TIR domain-containing protein n=1 Tax=Haemonchus contortus TaxID=6289 RepID=A0A7I4YCL4_HAECO